MEDAEEGVQVVNGAEDLDVDPTESFDDPLEEAPQIAPPGLGSPLKRSGSGLSGAARRVSKFVGIGDAMTFPKGYGDDIMVKLQNAKSAGRLARLQMTLPPFGLGLLILVLSFFLFGANLLMAPATLCVAMSLLPTDHFRMKLVGSIALLIVVWQAISLAIRTWRSLTIAYGEGKCMVRDEYRLEIGSETKGKNEEYQIPCATVAILSYMAICFILANLFAAAHIVRSARFGTRQRIELFWKTCGTLWQNYAWIISYCVVSMLSTPQLRENEPTQIAFLAANAVVMFGVGKAFHYPKLRVTFQGFLLSKGEHTSAAAGIAGLLGSGDPYEVRKMAQSRFRAVSMDHITEDDLKDSKPNPKLYEKSEPASIGSVDCFVSHSWVASPPALCPQSLRILTRSCDSTIGPA